MQVHYLQSSITNIFCILIFNSESKFVRMQYCRYIYNYLSFDYKLFSRLEFVSQMLKLLEYICLLLYAINLKIINSSKLFIRH